MTKDEALDLALEALESMKETLAEHDEPTTFNEDQAIAAIKQARALDKKAENARELGLDYEPVAWVEYETGNHTKRPQNCGTGYCSCVECVMEPAPVQEPVAWREFDGEGGYDYYTYEHNENLRDKYIERNGEKYASWVEPLYTTPPAQPAPVQPSIKQGWDVDTLLDKPAAQR